jgi:amidase
MLDICFYDAIERANELDAHFEKTGKVIGPLQGLPVTLKDQFHVKGRETTLGWVGWVGTFEGGADDPRKGVVESELVRELNQLGAVIIGKVRETEIVEFKC